MMGKGGFMKLERIRALREDHDWTQQALADRLHINRRTYSAYENGVNAVPLEILAELSLIYQTSADYLLELTDVYAPYPPGRKRWNVPSEQPPFAEKR